MLTPKQEQYCKNKVLKGMTQKDAYKNSYNAKNMSDNAISVEACKLEANPKIAIRIKELEDEQTTDILKDNKWNRDEAYKELTWLLEKSKKEITETNSVNSSTANAIINCVKELNNIYDVAAEDTGESDDGFIEALSEQAKEVWDDEENGDVPI